MWTRLKNHIILLLSFVIINSCIEPIDLDIDRQGRQLVVFGHIDDGSGPFFVQLQRTTAIPFQFQPETGARITLHDDLGNEGRFFSSNDEGKYFYNEFTMPIESGRSYFIRIRTAGREFYESEPEYITPFEAQSQVEVEFDRVAVNTGSFDAVVNKNMMLISASTILENPNTDYYLRYYPTQTFRFDPTNFPDNFNTVPPPCYVIRPVQPERLTLYSSRESQGLEVPSIFLGRQEIDYAFITRNIISVETHAMTPEAYEYWRKVGILLNNTGSIFDTPPAAIQGNIFKVDDPEEEVLGYFEATNVHFSRVEKWRSAFPYPVPEDPCVYSPSRENYPRECLDCRTLEGSGYRRPSYY
jgi:hypothetical protein